MTPDWNALSEPKSNITSLHEAYARWLGESYNESVAHQPFDKTTAFMFLGSIISMSVAFKQAGYPESALHARESAAAIGRDWENLPMIVHALVEHLRDFY